MVEADAWEQVEGNDADAVADEAEVDVTSTDVRIDDEMDVEAFAEDELAESLKMSIYCSRR
jgi:hypothetical protein